MAHLMDWAEDFLCEMQKREVPIDFFSWHIYSTNPMKVKERSNIIHGLLQKYGYGDAESHLNEWNYVRGWHFEDWKYTVRAIHGMKGAAYIMACMAVAQQADIDLLMYYDTRPSVFNGLFDYYSHDPLKGYYTFYWYGMFYDLQAEIKAENAVDDIYSLCGVDAEGKVLSVITYYTDDDAAEKKQLTLDFGKNGRYEFYLLDEDHTNELIATTEDLSLELKPNSCILIKEI